MLVPLFSSHNSADSAGGRPAQPAISIVCDAVSFVSRSPSRRRLSIMTRVSSLSSTPVRRDEPSASAATIRARLVTLLEPGGRTVARMGPRTDSIAIEGFCVGSFVARGWLGSFTVLDCNGSRQAATDGRLRRRSRRELLEDVPDNPQRRNRRHDNSDRQSRSLSPPACRSSSAPQGFAPEECRLASILFDIRADDGEGWRVATVFREGLTERRRQRMSGGDWRPIKDGL
jgi:hypothetical protein